MYNNWCSKISCPDIKNVHFPLGTDIDVKLLHSTLPFIFDSLDDNESEWQDLRTTWAVENVKIVPIEEEAGLLPAAFRIIISFHSYYKPYTVLFKVRNVAAFEDGETKEKENQGNIHVMELEPYVELHERELDFYKYVKQRIEVPVPKVYYMQSWDLKNGEDGVIVMQDLIHEGIRQNVYCGFTPSQVKAILSHMAHFHANIFKASDCRDLLKKFPPLKEKIPEFSKHGLLEKLGKTGSEYFANNAKIMAHFINSTDLHYDMDEDKLKVLVHGTLWTVNVKFKKSWMGSACDDVRAIINWQHCHRGSPIEDVARLIISSTDASVRQEFSNEFLQFYFHEMESNLVNDGITVPYTVDEFRDQFKRSFPKEVLFLMISHIPFLLIPQLYERANDEQKQKLLHRLETAAEDAFRIESSQ